MSILEDSVGGHEPLRLMLLIVRAVGLRRALLLRRLALGRRRARPLRSLALIGAGSVLAGAALWSLTREQGASPGPADEEPRGE